MEFAYFSNRIQKIKGLNTDQNVCNQSLIKVVQDTNVILCFEEQEFEQV